MYFSLFPSLSQIFFKAFLNPGTSLGFQVDKLKLEENFNFRSFLKQLT